jgi:predicted TIM-barrel fold metal-dependent hydrolase
VFTFALLSLLTGPDKIAFGSNFPVEKVVTTYTKLVRDLEISLRGQLSKAELQKVFHDNAVRLYRLS